ncbi:ATP-binding cassette domain-containing protein [Paenarthrobacter nicotinovorans]|uniref:ATP-binding cassette domain-containing protein n=1 Tax=Paenarthrobacter nicotinovorans TaxID=29320 RepID=UPI003749CCFC
MLLAIENVTLSYGGKSGPPVLRNVSLNVGSGESVGLVGESGSGKSTLIRCILKLTPPSEGHVMTDGHDVWKLKGKPLQNFRRDVQIIFQDPKASLNPRMTVRELVEEGLIVHKLEPSADQRKARVIEVLRSVGLDETTLNRYPASFSGGQQQRIAIARALAVRPRLLVCDEPVSALDVSVQAQVINLLQDLQRDLGLALLFVAHDLAVVRHLCERAYVLCAGEIVESGPRSKVFDAPEHAYTKALLAAVPVPEPASR